VLKLPTVVLVLKYGSFKGEILGGMAQAMQPTPVEEQNQPRKRGGREDREDRGGRGGREDRGGRNTEAKG
jgi:hypothetical protein